MFNSFIYGAGLTVALVLSVSNSFQNPGARYRHISSHSFDHPIKTLPILSYGDLSAQIHSLQSLVEDIETDASSGDPRVVFVGGKGGVGKTTIASSLAVSLASAFDKDLRVLIVSTDPAHSLGDALDEDLRPGMGKPMIMTDPMTSGKLFACEVDARRALDDFRSSLEAFDINRLADSLGVNREILEGFGLQEFSGLLNNPPPGLDELVALATVLDSGNDFDVVVVDTAPTGHTLRLLSLPKFLDGFLGRLIQLRMKLAGVASTLQAFLGGQEAQQRAQTIDNAMDKLEAFRTKMSRLRNSLQDARKTSFVVVSVPTKLSVVESERLISELGSQGVSVTDIVVNQCLGNGDDSSDAVLKYYERISSSQQKWISQLQEAVNDVSASKEYQENGESTSIGLTQVPFFDVELVGIPALAYLGSQCFSNNPTFSDLMSTSSGDLKMVICGGKGGVGKTTTSSALAVSMAAQGRNVALVSTDPAHSLGDAIDINLAGGELQSCPLIGVAPTEGSLSALEIDPKKALSKFKSVIDQLLGKTVDSGGGNEVMSTLQEFGQLFDTLPAGTDEVVALAKVVNIVKKGDFDRIVLDTAPTGHTLRMLSTPGFLAELIDKVLVLAEKLNSNSMVRMMINNAAGDRVDDLGETVSSAKSALLQFQLQMYDLEDLIANADQTEFLIVTVPTELAVRESIRLLNDLTYEDPEMPVKVRHIVANQVLRDDGTDIAPFLERVSSGQKASIERLESFISSTPNSPRLTKVHLLDTEPRGVFGLKVLAEELTRSEAEGNV